MQLLLWRHGKSCWDNPHLTDHQRPLNERGQRSARAVADYARAHFPQPDLVWCSDSVRTQETHAAALERHWLTDVPCQFRHECYHASCEELMRLCYEAKLPAGRTLLIIGHNPGLAEFLDAVVPATSPPLKKFPTAACAWLDLPHWPPQPHTAQWRGLLWPRALTRRSR